MQIFDCIIFPQMILQYKTNLMKLKNFVMVMFAKDTMVDPKETEVWISLVLNSLIQYAWYCNIIAILAVFRHSFCYYVFSMCKEWNNAIIHILILSLQWFGFYKPGQAVDKYTLQESQLYKEASFPYSVYTTLTPNSVTVHAWNVLYIYVPKSVTQAVGICWYFAIVSLLAGTIL